MTRRPPRHSVVLSHGQGSRAGLWTPSPVCSPALCGKQEPLDHRNVSRASEPKARSEPKRGRRQDNPVCEGSPFSPALCPPPILPGGAHREKPLGRSANVSHSPYPPPSSRFPLRGSGFHAFLGLEGMRLLTPDPENPLHTYCRFVQRSLGDLEISFSH